MFEQFAGTTGEKTGSRKRFRTSLLVSVVVYGVLALGVGTVMATVRTVVQQEDLVQITFAPTPQREAAPEPPPPPPEPLVKKQGPRPRVKRDDAVAPDAIPNERPEESDGALVDAEPSGPVDGFLDGTGDGEGGERVAPPNPETVVPPPDRRPGPPSFVAERIDPPVPVGSNASPVYPMRARRTGVQGVVVAKIVVRADGTVGRIEILAGPEIFHETVRETLRSWRFTPARFEGRPVTVLRLVRFPFRLENMSARVQGVEPWTQSGGVVRAS